MDAFGLVSPTRRLTFQLKHLSLSLPLSQLFTLGSKHLRIDSEKNRTIFLLLPSAFWLPMMTCQHISRNASLMCFSMLDLLYLSWSEILKPRYFAAVS